MGNHKAFSIDDLVKTKLSYTGSRVTIVAEVGTPTLDTPAREDANPMEWLTNPVGLDVTPRSQVTWEESGKIINPAAKVLAYVIA